MHALDLPAPLQLLLPPVSVPVSERVWAFTSGCDQGLRIRCDGLVGGIQHGAHVTAGTTAAPEALTESLARQRSGIIAADKLLPECRSLTRRKLTQMEALERDAIVRSLQDNGGNKPEAARALGMSRATIYFKTNDYGIA